MDSPCSLSLDIHDILDVSLLVCNEQDIYVL